MKIFDQNFTPKSHWSNRSYILSADHNFIMKCFPKASGQHLPYFKLKFSINKIDLDFLQRTFVLDCSHWCCCLFACWHQQRLDNRQSFFESTPKYMLIYYSMLYATGKQNREHTRSWDSSCRASKSSVRRSMFSFSKWSARIRIWFS